MKLRVDLKEKSYNIFIEKGLLDRIGELVKNISRAQKITILTDGNVHSYYGEKVKRSLMDKGYEVKNIVLKAGEATKSFNTLPGVYNELLDFKMTRSDLIITLGGGVIGDLGGFVASSFLRGIDFIQIPTSLLAQVDSSVGGKVGVDLERGKNLVGSFYHPKAVFIDPNVLDTLEDRFFKDGMAEVIKYGCIKDAEFFYKLKSYKNKDVVMENIEDIIYKCCDIKRDTVEKDEKDKGERMLLNFGHTLGHAIEQHYHYSKYTHGEGVAIGMYEITKISETIGITKRGTSNAIKDILVQYGLPYKMDIKKEEVLEAITLDKKNLDKNLNVIILKELGVSFINKTTVEFFI